MGFELTSDSSYSAVIVANNISSNKITVNYSVSGTAKSDDTDQSSSDSVAIEPNDPDIADEIPIDLLIRVLKVQYINLNKFYLGIYYSELTLFTYHEKIENFD